MPLPRSFTVEQLEKLWKDYKKHIDNNPDKLQKATNKGVQIEEVKRPYTQSGFYAYVYNTERKHIHQYVENKDGLYDEYVGIVTHIKNEWRSDQIEGTMTGRYKAQTLTARLNNLSEKVEQTNIERPIFKGIDLTNKD